MMKIAIAQLNYHIGNFEYNTQKIQDSIHKAVSENADLIVFSELAVCGYFPMDLLDQEGFIERCGKSIEMLKSSSSQIDIIIGCPSFNDAPKGKHLHNSAFYLSKGEIKDVIHKSLLPDYDVFDEYRYFEPSLSSAVIHCGNTKIALTICEDLWDIEEPLLYTQSPMTCLGSEKPDLIINIAASPFTYSHFEERIEVLRNNAIKFKVPVVYVNQVGANTQIIFDGGSLMMNKEGRVTRQLKFFEEDFQIVEFDSNSLITTDSSAAISKTERIHKALVLGISDYFSKMGFSKAILGLSGGIDSALTYALAVEALGVENVHGVLLPSQYSSQHSIDDAIKLVENCGGKYDLVKIEDAYHAIYNSLTDDFKSKPSGLAEENLQARIRAIILMALSNKEGSILLNTSNKSEMAVGYGTLYGDMCGGLAVLGDVYKTEVYELSEFMNRNEEIIPYNTLKKAPSAELRPDQKDSDSLPDYAVLDAILFQYIEQKSSLASIVASGFDYQLAGKVIRLVNMNEYKRHQAPPVLRVSSKAFGSGRKMPIVAKF